jgi:hypothetical protein
MGKCPCPHAHSVEHPRSENLHLQAGRERWCRVRGNVGLSRSPSRESKMHYCGIDVSKATLHVHLLDPQWSRSVPNTPAGHRAIIKRLGRLTAYGSRTLLDAPAFWPVRGDW